MLLFGIAYRAMIHAVAVIAVIIIVTISNDVVVVVYLCGCVSADMSPYCSAHDEWLNMKRYNMSGTMMPTMCQILVVTQ